MPKAVVLGCGKVGSVMASDLAAKPTAGNVLAVDPSPDSLAAGRRADAGIDTPQAPTAPIRPIVTALAEAHDIVIGALPSFRSATPRWRPVIRTGTPLCDISFMTDEFLRPPRTSPGEHQTAPSSPTAASPPA